LYIESITIPWSRGLQHPEFGTVWGLSHAIIRCCFCNVLDSCHESFSSCPLSRLNQSSWVCLYMAKLPVRCLLLTSFSLMQSGSAEWQRRAIALAQGWGSVNINQLTHQRLKLCYSPREGRGGSLTTWIILTLIHWLGPLSFIMLIRTLASSLD